MADSQAIVFGTGSDAELSWGGSYLNLNTKGNDIRIMDGLTTKVHYDASSNSLGIGVTGDPARTLHINRNDGTGTLMKVENTGASAAVIEFSDTGTTDTVSVGSAGNELILKSDDGGINFSTTSDPATASMVVARGGNVVIGNGGTALNQNRLNVISEAAEPIASFYRKRNAAGGTLVDFKSDVGSTANTVGRIYSEGAIDFNEYILNNAHNGRITYGTATHGASNSATTIEIHADAAVEIHERDDTNHMVWRVSTNDGQMQVPLQPSFTAYRNGSYTLGSGDVEISFNVALYNVGNDYNGDGSRFTAPVDGMYHFTATISGYSTSTQVLEHTDDSAYLTFKKNGAEITGRNSGSASAMFNWGYLTKNGVEFPVHISMNIQLDANEYVEVEAGDISSGISYTLSNAVFSGYLIG
jgi:hypothetical protein